MRIGFVLMPFVQGYLVSDIKVCLTCTNIIRLQRTFGRSLIYEVTVVHGLAIYVGPIVQSNFISVDYYI